MHKQAFPLDLPLPYSIFLPGQLCPYPIESRLSQLHDDDTGHPSQEVLESIFLGSWHNISPQSPGERQWRPGNEKHPHLFEHTFWKLTRTRPKSPNLVVILVSKVQCPLQLRAALIYSLSIIFSSVFFFAHIALASLEDPSRLHIAYEIMVSRTTWLFASGTSSSLSRTMTINVHFLSYSHSWSLSCQKIKLSSGYWWR